MNPSLVVTAPPAAEAARTPAGRAFAPVSVIEDAIAILARRGRCTAEEAFAVLRTTAHRRKAKLREVAEELVASLHNETPPDVTDEPALSIRRESYWD